ncbi:hypothetical protein [uncultured Paraglaciecola sp.]|uniref:hypothetical protein n=1 Tax=uncultured Paraglaciecola sp. TaxID=1765024 RepID=UPI00262A7096|nr:hypothetical protein [uncultured Paraglaciecola sp.]
MSETVFRIQDADGRGPFKPGFSSQWVEIRADHQNLKSWLDEFGPIQNELLVGEYAACGCKTIAQLKRWFTKAEYKRLRRLGYNAMRIEVGRILAESEIQCVFGSAHPLNKNTKIVRLY